MYVLVWVVGEAYPVVMAEAERDVNMALARFDKLTGHAMLLYFDYGLGIKILKWREQSDDGSNR